MTGRTGSIMSRMNADRPGNAIPPNRHIFEYVRVRRLVFGCSGPAAFDHCIVETGRLRA